MQRKGVNTKIPLLLSWHQVHNFRLTKHNLLSRTNHKSLIDAVRSIGGVQAQISSSPEIALWARVSYLKPENIEYALLNDRSLLKTWSLRGTVHILPSEDLPIYINALRQSVALDAQRWVEKKGLDLGSLNAIIDVMLDTLSFGPLTRRELSDRIVSMMGKQVRPWIEHSWGIVIKVAALRGLVCHGPNRGQEVTFVRIDRWLPKIDFIAEKAIEKLFHRYLSSYGPATVGDFCNWTGVRSKEIRLILEKSKSKNEIIEVSTEGQLGFLLTEDIKRIQDTVLSEESVSLLPSFDPYMLGHRDKKHLVDQTHYKAVYRKAGWLSPVVLYCGQVIGRWEYRKRGGRLNVYVQPFVDLIESVRSRIRQEAENLGHFWNLSSDIWFNDL